MGEGGGGEKGNMLTSKQTPKNKKGPHFLWGSHFHYSTSVASRITPNAFGGPAIVTNNDSPSECIVCNPAGYASDQFIGLLAGWVFFMPLAHPQIVPVGSENLFGGFSALNLPPPTPKKSPGSTPERWVPLFFFQ